MLSIIIPARNEAENLQDIFDYFNLELAKMDYEVVNMSECVLFPRKK